MPHVAANTQRCWQRYINRPRCQPVFPISDVLFKPENILVAY